MEHRQAGATCLDEARQGEGAGVNGADVLASRRRKRSGGAWVSIPAYICGGQAASLPASVRAIDNEADAVQLPTAKSGIIIDCELARAETTLCEQVLELAAKLEPTTAMGDLSSSAK